VWLVKHKLKKKREAQIMNVPDLINLEIAMHKEYLRHDRYGKRSKEDAIYWRGKRDGIRAIWK